MNHSRGLKLLTEANKPQVIQFPYNEQYSFSGRYSSNSSVNSRCAVTVALVVDVAALVVLVVYVAVIVAFNRSSRRNNFCSRCSSDSLVVDVAVIALIVDVAVIVALEVEWQ